MEEIDFYSLLMIIESEDGKKTEDEHYRNLSLQDFEVIYGNETRKILAIVLTKQDSFDDGNKKGTL